MVTGFIKKQMNKIDIFTVTNEPVDQQCPKIVHTFRIFFLFFPSNTINGDDIVHLITEILKCVFSTTDQIHMPCLDLVNKSSCLC